MIFNVGRERERQELAHQLWRAPYRQLLRYGITSYRDVTGIDTVGISVWTSCRPAAHTISITAGKSTDPLMGFAGCLTEAIEFWAAENPWGEFVQTSHAELAKQDKYELLPFRELALTRDAICDEGTMLAFELVDRIHSGLPSIKAWMPSDLIWLDQRMPTQFTHFQMTSNGVASGCRYEDAVLSGLYELVERDAWTLSRSLIQTTGEWPKKLPLTGLPPDLEMIVEQMREAGLYPFLFDVTTTVGVPAFGATLFDSDQDGAGAFGGYGCALHPHLAAKRALLESAQSRLCYIGGARDDLFRREFLLLKKTEQKKAIATAEGLPCATTWDEAVRAYPAPVFETIDQELQRLLTQLEDKGIRKIYVRQLAAEAIGNANLTVVRVITPQLEPVIFDHWQSNGRANAYVSARVGKAA
jgi:YcaO-like protein with predicted kinase domain